ncbi:hypothetical protein LTR85_005838 [Meristemomyces frigidus]|nr:hypothetical protein LTR85_005838 [Meristemomyces frigidus]
MAAAVAVGSGEAELLLGTDADVVLPSELDPLLLADDNVADKVDGEDTPSDAVDDAPNVIEMERLGEDILDEELLREATLEALVDELDVDAARAAPPNTGACNPPGEDELVEELELTDNDPEVVTNAEQERDAVFDTDAELDMGTDVDVVAKGDFDADDDKNPEVDRDCDVKVEVGRVAGVVPDRLETLLNVDGILPDADDWLAVPDVIALVLVIVLADASVDDWVVEGRMYVPL